MTTYQIGLEYDGSRVDGAINFQITRAMNSKGSASFSLPNDYHKAFNTWKGRLDDEIKIYTYNDSGTKTSLLFQGYVKSVSSTNPMTVSCYGLLGILDWGFITDEQGQCRQDSVVVASTPASTILTCESDEGETALGWTTNQFAPPNQEFYAIISDNTLDDSNTNANIDNVSLTNATVDSGSMSDTNSQDGTYYVLKSVNLNTTTNKIDVRLGITDIIIADQLIQVTIEIFGKSKITNSLDIFHNVGEFELYWSKDGTSEDFLLYNSVMKNNSEQFIMLNRNYIIRDNNTDWFEQGTTYWNKPHLIFRMNATDYTTTSAYSLISIDYVKITLTYATATFEQINQKISYTADNGTVASLKCYQDDFSTDFDFTSNGVRANDKVTVCIGLYEAIQRCFTAPGVPIISREINNGSTFGRGVAQNYEGVITFQMFNRLIQTYGLIFWVKYSELDTPIVMVRLADQDTDEPNMSYIADATTTLTSDYLPINPLLAENNLVGYVAVQWKDGITEIYPTGNSNPKYKLIKRRDILTEAEAIRLAKKEAEQYSSTNYSLNLTWNHIPTDSIYVGVKYNIAVPSRAADDSFTTTTYSNQLCRRITIKQDGANNAYTVQAWFGRGMTPPDEKLGYELAQMNNQIQITEAYQSASGEVSRHSQLLGVTANQHHDQSHDNTDHSTNYEAETFIRELLQLTSTYRRYKPCPFAAFYPSGSGYISNTTIKVGSGTTSVQFLFPFPTYLIRNGTTLKLYIDTIAFYLGAADTSNYVNRTQLIGVRGVVQLANSTTAFNTSGYHTVSFTAVDCSAYDQIGVQISVTTATTGNLNINFVKLMCYYA